MAIQTGETNNLEPSGSPMLAPTVPEQPKPDVVADTQKFYDDFTSQPITPQSLQPEAPFVEPEEEPEPDYGAILKGIPTVEDFLGKDEDTEAEKNVGEFQTKILDLSKGLGTKEAEQLRAEEAAGLAGWKKELQASNQRLKEHIVGSVKRFEAALETGETISFSRGEANKVARTDAIRGMELALQVEAMRGNLELSQSQADRVIALKFAPIEAEYKYLLTAYTLNKDILEREDKEKTNKLAIALDDRRTVIEERKANAQKAYDMAIKAIESNPGNLNALASAKEIFNLEPSDPKYIDKAFNLVGKYQAKPEKGKFETIEDAKGNVYEVERDARGKIIGEPRLVLGEGGDGIGLETATQNLQTEKTPASIKSFLASIFRSKGKDISQGTKTEIGNVVNVSSALEDFANANLEGQFVGLGAGAGGKRFLSAIGTLGISELVRVFGREKTKAERAQNRQFIEAVNLKVQQWASGASLTETQTEQVERLTPVKSDNDRELKRKINGLYNFMIGQAQSKLLTEGVNVSIPKVDLFEIQDLASQASPEQLAELQKLLNQ